MLKLYAELERIAEKRIALILAAKTFGLYPESEDVQEKIDEKQNIYDIRHNLVTEVIYIRELCSDRNEPYLMHRLFNEANWNADMFEWLEIDPETGVGIEPKTDIEIILHNLRATHGRYIFNNLRTCQMNQKIVDTYVFQSPGFRGSYNGDQADIDAIPTYHMTEDIVVYIAQTCNESVIHKLPSCVFTESLVQRLADEAPASVLSHIPMDRLTDAVLFRFYRRHSKPAALNTLTNIGSGRKTELLETAMAQSHIDHQLLRNICRSIPNLDELPGDTMCRLVHNSPYLLQLFLSNSTVFDNSGDGIFQPFAHSLAYEALTCNRSVPSPYDKDRKLYDGKKVARKLLPAELIEAFDKSGGLAPNERAFGIVRWHIEDIMAAASKINIDMTPDEAVNWWKMNESSFKNRMTELGNEVLADMLSYEKGENT